MQDYNQKSKGSSLRKYCKELTRLMEGDKTLLDLVFSYL